MFHGMLKTEEGVLVLQLTLKAILSKPSWKEFNTALDCFSTFPKDMIGIHSFMTKDRTSII